MEQVCAEPEIGAGKRSGDPLSRRADGAEPGWETGKMSNSPHTLDFGNGTLLEKGVLRIWIGSRLTPSGKCRLRWRRAINVWSGLRGQKLKTGPRS